MEHKEENIGSPNVAPISEGKYKGLIAHYDPKKIWVSDFPDMGMGLYLTEVEIDGILEKPMLPIFILNFSEKQKEEIMVERNFSSDAFEKPEGLDYIHVSTKENMERILGPLDEKPPKKGNHSSLVDDLHLGEFIDAIIELKESS